MFPFYSHHGLYCQVLACLRSCHRMDGNGSLGKGSKLQQHDHNTTQNVTDTDQEWYQTYQKEHISTINSDPPAPKKAIDFRWCKIQTYISEGWDHHSISKIWLDSSFNWRASTEGTTPPFYSARGFCRKFVALTCMFVG